MSRQKSNSINSSLTKSQPNIIQNEFSLDSNQPFVHIGPLSAFTAEAVDIIREAEHKIYEGKDLRAKSKILMKESIENAKQMSQLVNDAFLKKIEDTLLLSVRK